MKVCKDCGLEKPTEDFYEKFNYCKQCSSIRHANWREKNKEKHQAYSRFWHIQNQYGLTPEQYERMKSKGCAICGSDDQLAVDHDHSCCPGKKTCGKCIRGMLCKRHNWAAGNLNDSASEALAMAKYLWRSDRCAKGGYVV